MKEKYRKDKVLQIRVTEEEYKRLEKLAKLETKTEGELIKTSTLARKLLLKSVFHNEIKLGVENG